ncbi:MAG: WxcM-like domain-containing protein [Rhodomicrobium sp.]
MKAEQRDFSPSNAAPLIHPAAQIDATASIGLGVILPANVAVEPHAEVEAGVVFAGGDRTIVRSHCRIGAGAVVGPDVELGRGCEIRAGSAVLKSVPPNAVVEGNPAVIVGYTHGELRARSNDLKGSVPPGRRSIEPLGVGDAKLYRFKRINDLRGSLTAVEMEKELPFLPRRYFVVFDVPSSELRGEHAHKQCHQFLVALHGSCRVLLDDGSARAEVTLDSQDVAVYMPPMIWGTQYRYTRDAVLLVFASHPYDAKDYIRTYDEFLGAIRKLSS